MEGFDRKGKLNFGDGPISLDDYYKKNYEVFINFEYLFKQLSNLFDLIDKSKLDLIQQEFLFKKVNIYYSDYLNDSLIKLSKYFPNDVEPSVYFENKFEIIHNRVIELKRRYLGMEN